MLAVAGKAAGNPQTELTMLCMGLLALAESFSSSGTLTDLRMAIVPAAESPSAAETSPEAGPVALLGSPLEAMGLPWREL